MDSQYQNSVNNEGETLIPPTLLEFSTTFSGDLQSTFNLKVPVVTGDAIKPNSIFVTLGDSSSLVDAAGRPTSRRVRDRGYAK